MLLMTFHLILGSVLNSWMIQPVINSHRNFDVDDCNFKNSLNQLETQKILKRIDEKLTNLERGHVFRHKLRNENSFGEQLEKFDQRLTHLESRIEAKFDKFLESVSNRNFKDDIVKDSQSRKIDIVYERINHRIGFVEAKLYTSFVNLQSSSDKLTKKFEKLESNFETKQNDIENDLSLMMNMIEDIRVQFLEDKLMNITSDIVKLTIDQFDKQIADIASETKQKTKSNSELKLTRYFEELNNSADSEIENVFSKYWNKITDVDSNFWKKIDEVENLVKISMALTNLTRREIQDNYKSLLHRIGINQYKSHSNNTFENIIEILHDRVDQSLNNFKKQFDMKFHEIIFNQKLFLENCHRIQIDEQQLDSKISLVLEKLLDMFINNTSGNHFELKHLHETLESHDYQIKDVFNEGIKKILENLISENSKNSNKKLQTIPDNPKANTVDNLIQNINKLMNLVDVYFNEILEQIQDFELKLSKSNSTEGVSERSDIKLKWRDIMSDLNDMNREIVRKYSQANHSVNKNISKSRHLDNVYDLGSDHDSETDYDYDH